MYVLGGSVERSVRLAPRCENVGLAGRRWRRIYDIFEPLVHSTRRVTARGGGGVARHWFVCLSELRARAASYPRRVVCGRLVS